LFGPDDCPANAIGGPSEGGIDGAALRIRAAPCQGEISADEAAGTPMISELGRELSMRLICLRDHQNSTGVLVESMNDSRPVPSAERGERTAAMMQQGIDERPAADPRSGRDDHARRLLDHDDMLVFMQDGQRHRLGLKKGRFGPRTAPGDLLSRNQPLGWY